MTDNNGNSVTLRDYLEGKFDHEREMRLQLIDEQRRALAIATMSMDKRLEGMNELRAQINSERGNYVSLQKHDGFADAILAKIDGLARMVYVGLGIILAVQALLFFFKR